jgi:ribonuclease-3
MYSGLIERLGVSISADLLERALTHRSFSYEFGGVPTNERLEFLGDSVLGLVITDLLFRLYPELSESSLSPLRSAVVNTKALASLAREFDVGSYIRIGKGEESSGGREKNSILADSFEALIGAIYLELGLLRTQELLHVWFAEMIKTAHARGSGVDGKTALQEFCADVGLVPPVYEISESGPDHDKSFTAIAIISSERFPIGVGKSKREAEQDAARIALENLRIRTK